MKGLREPREFQEGKIQIQTWKDRVLELWEEGHMKKDYRAPKKQRDGQQEKNQEANVTSDVLQNVLIISIDNIFESWVVDSRASFNATPRRKHFLDYVQGDFGQVHLGDDAP